MRIGAANVRHVLSTRRTRRADLRVLTPVEQKKTETDRGGMKFRRSRVYRTGYSSEDRDGVSTLGRRRSGKESTN